MVNSFNPLPAHLQAVQEDLAHQNGGATTPAYGGPVMTGNEWDYVVEKDGNRR
jgi:hypothetical protein